MDPSGWDMSVSLALCLIVPCLSLALYFTVPCLKICVHPDSRVQINGALVKQFELVFRLNLRFYGVIVCLLVWLFVCPNTVFGYDLGMDFRPKYQVQRVFIHFCTPFLNYCNVQ